MKWPADQVERTFCRFKDWRRLATRFGVARRQEEDVGAALFVADGVVLGVPSAFGEAEAAHGSSCAHWL